jgi:hypothetical protein
MKVAVMALSLWRALSWKGARPIKACFGEAPKPAREARALPDIPARALDLERRTLRV